MLPGEIDARRESIFASDRDPANERWTGKIASKEDVAAATGIKLASTRRGV